MNGMTPCTLSHTPKTFTGPEYNHMKTILRYNEAAARSREENPNMGDGKGKIAKVTKREEKARRIQVS